MKRIITGVIALAAVLCTFAGCGDKSDSKNDKEAASAAAKTDEEKGTDAKSEAKDEKKEDKTLDWINDHLKQDSLFLLEARSIKDPMYNEGRKLSNTENFTNHYRRYMELDKIISNNSQIYSLPKFFSFVARNE